MSISITRLEKWDHKREYQILSDLYKTTRKTEWIRGPALIATEKCIGIRTFALTGSIAELTLKGLGLIFSSYPSSEQSLHGQALLKRVPWQVLNLIGGLVIGIIVGPIWISINPESYILLFKRQARVDFIHSEAGTIDTETYQDDLANTLQC